MSIDNMELFLNYGEACGEATKFSMRRNKNFCLWLRSWCPKVCMGQQRAGRKFGPERCFDTPLSEDAMTGKDWYGYEWLGQFIFTKFDFLLLCMNQLINIAAKVKYLSNGRSICPFMVRAIIEGLGQGAQHSQSFPSFIFIPGLTVLAPVTPHDMYNSMIWATKYDNPVIMVENRIYKNSGNIKLDENYLQNIRKLENGNDLTLISVSHI